VQIRAWQASVCDHVGNEAERLERQPCNCTYRSTTQAGYELGAVDAWVGAKQVIVLSYQADASLHPCGMLYATITCMSSPCIVLHTKHARLAKSRWSYI
jgi:hypothetical protein